MRSRPFVLLLLVVTSLCIVPAAVAGQSANAAATQPADAAADQLQFPVTLTDATGTEVVIQERPERVTTTNPSAAQVMWELGAESQVVGVTQFAHYLDGAESRQNVSSTELGVSIERVVATEPDLVLAPNATSPETVEALREAGLTVYHFPAATDFEDVKAKTLTIGQLTGNERAARETNAWVDANVEAVSAATADAERPRLLYPLLGGFAVGGDTFIDEIITASGAENVADDEFDGYEVLNPEKVITLKPEVVIVTDQTAGQILGSEPYSRTPAGEANRSVFLAVNYINQPAPRSIVYTTRNLTSQLHPELYDESDFVNRTAAAASVDYEATGERNGTETTDDRTEANTTDSASDGSETSVSAPGFGSVITLVALIGGSLLARRRPAN